jgi:hypothetical protein
MPGDQKHQSTDPPTIIPEADLGLNLPELASLLVAIGNYGREAEVCYNAGAYLASCIMLAARSREVAPQIGALLQ